MSSVKYVAVYGSLRMGFGNHRFLSNSEHVGNGVVYGWALHAYCNGFPAVYESTDGQDSVVVEVYEVTPNVARSLDSLEGFPHFYNRCVVDVDNVDVNDDIWMYFLDGEPESPLITHGDWKRYKETGEL